MLFPPLFPANDTESVTKTQLLNICCLIDEDDGDFQVMNLN